MLEVTFILNGKKRKDLATAISKLTGETVVYKGTPSFAYEVGNITVGKETIQLEESQIDLLNQLNLEGFDFDTPPIATEEETLIDIEIKTKNFDEVAFENLRKILSSKGELFNRAFATDSLTFDYSKGGVIFRGFKKQGTKGEGVAYMNFCKALTNMAIESKRISAKAKPIENEKFTMRVFLIRLGLIGEEFKLTRKILLQNLTGNTAFKGGRPDVSK